MESNKNPETNGYYTSFIQLRFDIIGLLIVPKTEIDNEKSNILHQVTEFFFQRRKEKQDRMFGNSASRHSDYIEVYTCIWKINGFALFQYRFFPDLNFFSRIGNRIC